MKYEFARHRIDKLSRTKLVEELVRVAREHEYVSFGRREFDQLATVSSHTVIREFGSWTKAIDFLRSELANSQIALRPKHRGHFSEVECFTELERVWRRLGHRPSKIEWESANPSIGYHTYVRYFGGWTNACLRFLESHGHPAAQRKIAEPRSAVSQNTTNHPRSFLPSRNVAAGLRLRVYERDRFRCVFCGRSPITTLDVQLHVDHIVPFAKGGRSELGNLQTLCSTCNLGKGARSDVQRPYA